MDTNHFDVIVIGSGLSGLTAGLHCQKAGLKVLVLEQLDRAGGLLGTYELDGYEFVIGCNEFGSSMEREMRALDVPITFKAPRTRFVFNHKTYNFPPGLGLMLGMLGHFSDLMRFTKACKQEQNLTESLASMVEKNIKNQTLAQLVLAFAYPSAIPPSKMSLGKFLEMFSKEFDYDYQHSRIPVGGPENLIKQMVNRFQQSGGRISLNTKVTAIASQNNVKMVTTEKGTYQAKHVISSERCQERFPKNAKSGLALNTLHLAVKKEYVYPKGFHTLAYFPPNVDHWMTQMDQGQLPEAFGFHLFCSDLPEKVEHYTINLYCTAPRGMEDPTQEQRQRIEDFILNHIGKLLPGVKQSILYQKLISPSEFHALHGLTSLVSPYVVADTEKKPESHDADKQIYYVGNSVYPPGEHACGTVLSGVKAAMSVIEDFTQS